MGGGFGSKGPLYREDVLTSYMALKLRRPVKWVATRSDDFVTTIQGRDQAMTSELALKKDGTMLGLEGSRRRQSRRLSAIEHGGAAAADDGDGAGLLSD